jgi:hypothetical protein
MQAANQSTSPSESSRANGQSHPHDLFMLTDEQILEIEPEVPDVEVVEVAPASLPASSSPVQNSRLEAGATGNSDAQNAQGSKGETQDRNSAQTQSAQAGLPVPPAWLAETMNDPQRGAEAHALWEGAQKTEKEAASYREVFARPEEARAAAERARVLDDIDRAYFTGDTSQRAQLAAMMMREDPAAFREMVFEGLRALEAAGQTGRTRSVADAVGATLGSPSAHGATAQLGEAPREHSGQASPAPTAQNSQLAAYAAFEKSANEDLERSVGSAIERTLEQALPVARNADGAALKGRMAEAIRQDVEKALQGDRQLGEQVAQILSGKRLDNEARAQVVRLIGERAQQLVPSATKRALKDWTQTTLAAHRSGGARTDAASSRREVAPTAPGLRNSQAQGTPRQNASHSSRAENRAESKGRVDYRRLSDDQILDL